MEYFDEDFKHKINIVYRSGDTLNFYGFTKLEQGVVMLIVEGSIILRAYKETDKKADFILVSRSVTSKELADTFEKHFALGRHFMEFEDAYIASHYYPKEDEEEFKKKFFGEFCAN